MLDEDADLRADLAALGPAALSELRRVLQGSADYRRDLLVALIARPEYSDLATLIAVADTDETTRLRLLRAITRLGLDCWNLSANPIPTHPQPDALAGQFGQG